MQKLLFSFVVSLSLCGCVAGPQGTVLQEEGLPPTLEQIQAVVMDDLQRTLRDPDSMKTFKIVSGPDVVTGITAGRAYEKAWLACVEYNAKNAYGGYTGLKTHSYVLRFNDGDLTVISRVNWIGQDRNC